MTGNNTGQILFFSFRNQHTFTFCFIEGQQFLFRPVINCIDATLQIHIILEGGPFHLEFLAVSLVSVSFPRNFCVCLFYRPPSSSDCIFNELCTTLQIVNPARFMFYVLLGDFNVNYLNKNHYLFPYISDILCTYSLSPSYLTI